MICADVVLRSQGLSQLAGLWVGVDVGVRHGAQSLPDLRGWPIGILVGVQLYDLIRGSPQPALCKACCSEIVGKIQVWLSLNQQARRGCSSVTTSVDRT